MVKPNDPIGEYFEAIERQPRLSDDQQKWLLRTLRAGGEDADAAYRRVVETTLYMVPPIARKYEGQGIAYLDLCQEGNLGLVRAVSTFDLDAPSFSQFAAQSIEAAISQAVRGR